MGRLGQGLRRVERPSGTWSVPPATRVFVCENPTVLEAAADELGRSEPRWCAHQRRTRCGGGTRSCHGRDRSPNRH
ncbi:DUF2399 domain-containing protein [Streptomyces phaeochromogenes]|nr:DUF2399 domain-containing protein [Streptomyces phaeochromogenes]